MRFYKTLLALVVGLITTGSMYAVTCNTSQYTWTCNTGNDMSVVISRTGATFDGAGLLAGDQIAAFTPAGLCVGAVVVPATGNIAFPVWGKDPATEIIDGLQNGEAISWKFWRDGVGELVPTTVTYTEGNGTFNPQLAFMVIGTFTVLAPPSGYTVNGTITYANTANTPMTNTTVQLKQGTTLIATTTTNAQGYFEFTDVADGQYQLVASTDKAWGGLNGTDAILLKRHIINYNGYVMNAIQLLAADVQFNNIINGTDAILIQRRLVNIPTSQWTLPNWVFETPTVTVSGANATSNFKGLCGGDINGSYTPPQ